MHSKILKTLLLFVPIFIFGFTAPLFAVAGDCNNDGMIMTSDMVAMIDYLASGIPIPGDSIQCDCDGHAGITIGDLMQIQEYLFAGGAVYPGPSTDLAMPSGVRFYYNSRIDFGATNPKDSVVIEIEVPAGFDIYGLQLAFCFPTATGEQDVEVASVDFTGSIISGNAFINNSSKNFHFFDSDNLNPIVSGGTTGKLCVVYFNLLSAPTDTPNQLEMCYTNRSTAVLFNRAVYNGTDRQRVYLPSFMRAPYGDCNSDQTTNVSDAVWIINYVFIGGLAPGYYEP